VKIKAIESRTKNDSLEKKSWKHRFINILFKIPNFCPIGVGENQSKYDGAVYFQFGKA
jgi:hypothetical protein